MFQVIKVFVISLKGFSHINFFFCLYNVILLEKLCKKVLYSMAKLFFNQKLFHFFCQNVPSSIIRKCILYIYMVYCIPYMEVTVDFLPYMVETVGKKKKAKTWRYEVDSKNSNFRDSFLNIEKEFHYTVKDFFA